METGLLTIVINRKNDNGEEQRISIRDFPMEISVKKLSEEIDASLCLLKAEHIKKKLILNKGI